MAKKILIAYFSKSGENLIDDEIIDIGTEGNTKKVAKMLQEKLAFLDLQADLFEIEPLIPYPYSYHECNERARQEKQDGAHPLINDGPTKFDFYDIVFLGYPNWWGTIPAPVASFLQNHNFEGKTIVPFVTHGGGIFLYSLDTIKEEAPKANMIKGFAIAAAYLSTSEDIITDWLVEHNGELN